MRCVALGWVAWVAVGLGGCGAHRITLEVLERPEVDVPAEVRALGVIDRSAPRGLGQQVLGIVEGIATGETVDADKNGRASAVQAAVEALRTSPRYDAITLVSVDPKQSRSTLFDKELDWDTAAGLAVAWKVDGILSLEAFDTDSTVETHAPGGGAVAWTAQRSTDVLTTWRLYDLRSRQIVDVLRETRDARTWTTEGATRTAAVAALPDLDETVVTVGRLAGKTYAHRIGPGTLAVDRAYFASGRLRPVGPSVRAGDWTAVIAAVTPITTCTEGCPSARTRGKAAFDLALAAEVRGDLDAAVRHAEQAATLLDNARARAYLAQLRERQGGTTAVADR